MPDMALPKYCKLCGAKLKPYIYAGTYDPWTGQEIVKKKLIKVVCPECGHDYGQRERPHA